MEWRFSAEEVGASGTMHNEEQTESTLFKHNNSERNYSAAKVYNCCACEQICHIQAMARMYKKNSDTVPKSSGTTTWTAQQPYQNAPW